MSEQKAKATETAAEETKFEIKVTEKAEFPKTLQIGAVKLSDIAASLNGLFSAYKDFVGSGFEVQTINGNQQIITYSLSFLPGQNHKDGVAAAFVPVDAETRGETRVERLIQQEKALKNSKKMELTKEGVKGLEKYILPYLQKNGAWKKKNIQEIQEKDQFGNVSKIHVKVTGIDYIACIKEVFGDKIETPDGLHDAVYNIQLKRMLTGMPVNMYNAQQNSMTDWLVEFVQGDTDGMNEFFREVGVFMNPNSPALNIVPR